MRTKAYEWFLWKTETCKAFCCYIACGDTFHAKGRRGEDIFEPCTVYDIRLAVECMLETAPEIGRWLVTVEPVQEHIQRVVFTPASIQ